MSGVVELARLFFRRGGSDRLGAGLSLVGFMVSTAFLLVAFSGLQGFVDRQGREDGWGFAAAAEGEQALVVVDAPTQAVQGRRLEVYAIAPAVPGGQALPPGVDRMPAPGEAFVSPALGELMEKLPADELADRIIGPGAVPGGRVAGRIDPAALPFPDSLWAVVGHAAPGTDPADPAPVAHGAGTPVTAFGPTGNDDLSPAAFYTSLASAAVVLMVVPLVTLSSTSARLGVSRRLSRLAALRLAGATNTQVVALTTLETTLQAALGALLGAGLYALILPIATTIPFQGRRFGYGELFLSPGVLAGVVAAVVVLAAGNAVASMGSVLVSPLGVAQRRTPASLRTARVVAFAAVLGVWLAFSDAAVKTGALVTVFGLGLVFAGLNLVGPWIIALLARIKVRTARTVPALLAARRLADQPKAAWTLVSGVSLAVFVAVLVNMMPLSGYQAAGNESVVVSLPEQRAGQADEDPLPYGVDPATAPALVQAVEGRLAERGLALPATYDETLGAVKVDLGVQATWADDQAPTGGAPLEAARLADRASTALAGVWPGAKAVPETVFLVNQQGQQTTVTTGALFVMVVTFIVAAVSTGIVQCAQILDQRRTYGLLQLAGTDLATVEKTRFLASWWPMLAAVSVSGATALLFALPFVGGMLPEVLSQPGALWIPGGILTGLGLTASMVLVTRPVTRRVFDSALRE